MTQLALVIDLNVCVGCHACVTSCKEWNTSGWAGPMTDHRPYDRDPTGTFFNRVQTFEVGQYPNTEVVHFYIHDLEPTYSRRVISDERARAHYFNNVGVELMLLGGDHIAALNYFQQSLHDDPSFSPAWISLGILYRREGYFSYAEAAFLQALETDPYNLVAMSNLASLYELTGKSEKSEYYKSEVKTHRLQNPYFRFELAREAFVNGNYDEAIDHLHAAIRRQDHESEFYSLLSLSYMMTGDSRSARPGRSRGAMSVPSRNRYSTSKDCSSRRFWRAVSNSSRRLSAKRGMALSR